MADTPAASPSGLSSLFNWHTFMWVGMAGTALAFIGAYPDPTVLDWILGIPMHMVNGAASFFGSGGETLSKIFSNTLSGNILPNHAADMWNAIGTPHVAHGAAALADPSLHAAHSACTGQAGLFDAWVAKNHAALPGIMDDAKFAGTTLWDYFGTNFCPSK